MKLKSLAMMIATGGLLAAAGPSSAFVACSTLATVGAWAAAGTCTDADSDSNWTYIATGTAGIDPNVGFAVLETELSGPGATDFYTLSLDWTAVGNLTATATLHFSATTTNTESFIAANFDTTVSEGIGTSGAKSNASFITPAGFVLNSNDGSRDPASGETPFPSGPTNTVEAVDTFFATLPTCSTPGCTPAFNQSGSINSFEVTVPQKAPEPASLALMGLGLAALAAIRRRGQGS